MSKIQGLILAAGRGSRLGNSAENVPKSLLQIGHLHLIEHQLNALADSGVGPVHLVVGYGADEVRETVGMRAEYIHNPRWPSTNSLYSFWLARDTIDGDVLVLNSDVLFPPEIVSRLLDQPGDAIAIDSSSGGGREQMKVGVVEGLVVKMSKELPADQVSGENVGLLKLSADTARALFQKAGELLGEGHDNEWIGASIAATASERCFHAVDIAGIPWVEIDFPVDLDRARKAVWPAIRGAAYKRRRVWRTVSWALGLVLLFSVLVLGRRAGPASPGQEWESIPPTALEAVQIGIDERSQGWWLLAPDRVAEARVIGPGPVRVESRLIDVTADRAVYILGTDLDGTSVDYHRIVTRPSGKARLETWTLSSKKRITLAVPAGSHLLQVRLIAPEGAPCLVRIRQLEADAEE